MAEATDLLKAIAEDKKVSPEQITQAAELIAFHESKLNPSSKQLGGGPGRGLFQYEIGKEASASAARKRAQAAFKRYNLEPPEWLSSLDNDYDPSELTEEQQFILFLGDHRERPNSDFAKLNEMPLADWWGKYHQTQDDPKKKETFNRDMQAYRQMQAKAKQAQEARTFPEAL